MEPADRPPIDAVLLCQDCHDDLDHLGHHDRQDRHDDRDHLDMPTVRQLVARGTGLFVPLRGVAAAQRMTAFGPSICRTGRAPRPILS